MENNEAVGRRRPREAGRGTDGHPRDGGDGPTSPATKRGRREQPRGDDPVRDALAGLEEDSDALSAEIRRLRGRVRAVGPPDAALVDRLRDRVRSLSRDVAGILGTGGDGAGPPPPDGVGRAGSETPGTETEDETDDGGDRRGDDRGSTMALDEAKSDDPRERDVDDGLAGVASSSSDEDSVDLVLVASELYSSEGKLAFCCQNCRWVAKGTPDIHPGSVHLYKMQTHIASQLLAGYAAPSAAARGGRSPSWTNTSTCETAAIIPASTKRAGMPSSTTRAVVIPRSTSATNTSLRS